MKFRRTLLAIFAFAALCGLQQQASATTIVAAGYDLFQTIGPTQFGDTSFSGVPLISYDFGGTVGLQPTGLTDTIVHRTTPAIDPNSPPVPGTAPQVSTELLALQLVGTSGTFAGDFVTLQSVHGGTPSTGGITVSFDGTGNAGTFNSFFDVFFDIRTGSLLGPIVFSGLEQFSASGSWSRSAPPGAVLIDGVNYLLDGSGTSADFFPAPFSEIAPQPIPAIHSVQTARIAEPITLSLFGAGLAGAVALRRRRKTEGRAICAV